MSTIKTLILSAGIVGAGLVMGSCAKRIATPQTPVLTLSTATDSAAYAFGIAQGESFRSFLGNIPGDSLSRDLIFRGFEEAYRGKSATMGRDEAMSYFQGYVQQMQARELAQLKERNDSALVANRTREGVHETESGLQWRELRAGTGVRPTVQDTVVVHYSGRTIDGKEFDSSYKRNQPATFSLLQVIPGWTEGICLMPVGSKYELYIPSALGYGERGAGGEIPPHATLIFEVELLDVKPYVEPAATEPASKATPKKKGKKK